MKKLICLILSVFLILLSGCAGGKIFDKIPEDGSLPIKEMNVGVFNIVSFSNLGYANDKNFYLTQRSLNGYSVDKNGYYVYDSVENFSEVTKDAKGIIVYHGLAYMVTEENGKEYLTVISDHAANYLRKYEMESFKKSAVNFHSNSDSAVSGGDGLLASDDLTSSLS